MNSIMNNEEGDSCFANNLNHPDQPSCNRIYLLTLQGWGSRGFAAILMEGEQLLRPSCDNALSQKDTFQSITCNVRAPQATMPDLSRNAGDNPFNKGVDHHSYTDRQHVRQQETQYWEYSRQ